MNNHRYTALRAFLLGYGSALNKDENDYWAGELGHEIDEELLRMSEGMNYSDEEMFDKFFEALDIVLSRNYPQYISEMNG